MQAQRNLYQYMPYSMVCGTAKGKGGKEQVMTDKEISEAFEEGQEDGYARGREDGYDEACMDLTDDDPGSSLYEEEPAARG